MTEVHFDGGGLEHEYCEHCYDEIEDTLESYDDDGEQGWLEWWGQEEVPLEDLDDDLLEDFSEGYQEVKQE